MALGFDSTRWQKLRATYRQWWAGQLERPLIPVVLGGRKPGRPEPAAPLLSQATCARLPRSFYHLDGKGQLPHLDSILTIADLDGVQWVPGDGQPGCGQWPEVYAKIKASGKKIQFLGGFDELDAVVRQIGTTRGIQVARATGENEADVRRQLARYGIE